MKEKNKERKLLNKKILNEEGEKEELKFNEKSKKRLGDNNTKKVKDLWLFVMILFLKDMEKLRRLSELLKIRSIMW